MEKFRIEVKEIGRSGFPRKKYKDKDKLVFAFKYPEPIQSYNPMRSPDENYQMFLDANIFIAHNDFWCFISHETFIYMIALMAGTHYSWPQAYKNHPKFNQWQTFQCWPFREGIRRHIHGNAIIDDIDMLILNRPGGYRKIRNSATQDALDLIFNP